MHKDAEVEIDQAQQKLNRLANLLDVRTRPEQVDRKDQRSKSLQQVRAQTKGVSAWVDESRTSSESYLRTLERAAANPPAPTQTVEPIAPESSGRSNAGMIVVAVVLLIVLIAIGALVAG